MVKRRARIPMQNESYVVRNEPAVEDWPRPERAPWSSGGLLIGTRHFGELCRPNPNKSASVRVLCPDIEQGDCVDVNMGEVVGPAAANGCVIL